MRDSLAILAALREKNRIRTSPFTRTAYAALRPPVMVALATKVPDACMHDFSHRKDVAMDTYDTPEGRRAERAAQRFLARPQNLWVVHYRASGEMGGLVVVC